MYELRNYSEALFKIINYPEEKRQLNVFFFSPGFSLTCEVSVNYNLRLNLSRVVSLLSFGCSNKHSVQKFAKFTFVSLICLPVTGCP